MYTPDDPLMTPELFARVCKFALFAAVQGAVCLLLSLLVGLIQMQLGKINEFAGLYLVAGLSLAPIYWLFAMPAHLFFYVRRQAPSSYLLSFLASGCVVLVGTALIYYYSR